ncbi:uncharacterized protein LOC129615652 [Condylostylus longicornis]|uniref:uncharacterized protein LOC129615652 n=1 Tax=Condylostylus longicornis TaxID=2530218 RepID=UPI00244E4447|nr:uncharacterized protein LOC129615652 [Condylostylus longicornis]
MDETTQIKSNRKLTYRHVNFDPDCVSVVVLHFAQRITWLRSRCGIVVNCWFCNENSIVPLKKKNSWVCSNSVCQQYNGFNIDGDYNVEIVEQFAHINNIHSFLQSPKIFNRENEYSNGFCFDCNRKQQLKIEKISQFEPKKESAYEAEFHKYKSRLENLYKLCPTCAKHLNRILQDKKKIVLGLKLSDFLFKKARDLKNFRKLVITNRISSSKWNFILNFLILLTSLFNFCYILIEIAKILEFHIETNYKNVTPVIFNIFDERIMNTSFLCKTFLIVKCVYIFVSHYVGLCFPKYVINKGKIIRFTCLLLSMFRSLIDGLEITRYTIILTACSVYFIVESVHYFDFMVYFKMLLSIVILIFSIPSLRRHSNMVASNSFHKIYLKDNCREGSTFFECTASHKNLVDYSKTKPKYFSGKICRKLQNAESFSNLNIKRKIDVCTLEYPFKTFKLNKDTSLLPFTFFHRSENSSITDNEGYGQKFESCQRKSTINDSRQFDEINNFRIANSSDDILHQFHQLSSDDIWKQYQCNFKNTMRQEIYTSCPFNDLAKVQKIKPSILSPPKFCHEGKEFATDTRSWVSGGYFNSSHGGDVNSFSQNISLSMLTKSNLSRASSQSSGFESNSSSIQKRLNHFGTRNNTESFSTLQKRNSCQFLDRNSPRNPHLEDSMSNYISEPFVFEKCSLHSSNANEQQRII